MSPLTLLVGAVAVLLFGFCVAWRFSRGPGRTEKALDAYRTVGMPRMMGNLYSLCGPSSLALVILVVGLSLGGFSAVVALLLASVLGLVSVYFAILPPGWAKPPWLRAGESTGRWPVQPISATDLVILVPASILLLVCAVVVGIGIASRLNG